ncbi:Oidioi.mRNA.OKI2018_I69.PAR.g8844.t1.cds [Oikopleura dioica]|uniref:Oidioi.mRNA.OKI2018_I69.PAR.g8844.t1.cds n=1 Tax=Oikopleura dioica TaxID=34765 RepID=A0ABN7RLY1_OIKDI|nr:Oidioi.mRNA.OKI2018_I69.PAR.g8844.t1.cds [Oikopleura dioica]
MRAFLFLIPFGLLICAVITPIFYHSRDVFEEDKVVSKDEEAKLNTTVPNFISTKTTAGNSENASTTTTSTLTDNYTVTTASSTTTQNTIASIDDHKTTPTTESIQSSTAKPTTTTINIASIRTISASIGTTTTTTKRKTTDSAMITTKLSTSSSITPATTTTTVQDPTDPCPLKCLNPDNCVEIVGKDPLVPRKHRKEAEIIAAKEFRLSVGINFPTEAGEPLGNAIHVRSG